VCIVFRAAASATFTVNRYSSARIRAHASRTKTTGAFSYYANTFCEQTYALSARPFLVFAARVLLNVCPRAAAANNNNRIRAFTDVRLRKRYHYTTTSPYVRDAINTRACRIHARATRRLSFRSGSRWCRTSTAPCLADHRAKIESSP